MEQHEILIKSKIDCGDALRCIPSQVGLLNYEGYSPLHGFGESLHIAVSVDCRPAEDFRKGNEYIATMQCMCGRIVDSEDNDYVITW